MPKNSKKRTRPAIKIGEQPKSYGSVYAATLARQVAAELTPIRTARKKKVAR